MEPVQWQHVAKQRLQWAISRLLHPFPQHTQAELPDQEETFSVTQLCCFSKAWQGYFPSFSLVIIQQHAVYIATKTEGIGSLLTMASIFCMYA